MVSHSNEREGALLVLDGVAEFLGEEDRWVKEEYYAWEWRPTTEEVAALPSAFRQRWDDARVDARACLVGAARHMGWLFLLNETNGEAEANTREDAGYRLAVSLLQEAIIDRYREDLIQAGREEMVEQAWVEHGDEAEDEVDDMDEADLIRAGLGCLWPDADYEDPEQTIIGFNDDGGTSWEDVSAVIASARARARELARQEALPH